MEIELLTERHAAQIEGVLDCWDRMLIFGTLPGACFAGGMTSYLYERKIRIFDYPKFAEPFRNQLRENAERLAAEAGLEIEFLRKRDFRKEDRVKEALAKRGEHPGLVCIFSAMEPCSTYKPWHNKETGTVFECWIDMARWVLFRSRLLKEIAVETDSPFQRTMKIPAPVNARYAYRHSGEVFSAKESELQGPHRQDDTPRPSCTLPFLHARAPSGQ